MCSVLYIVSEIGSMNMIVLLRYVALTNNRWLCVWLIVRWVLECWYIIWLWLGNVIVLMGWTLCVCISYTYNINNESKQYNHYI